MKHLLLLTLLACASFSLQAQLPDGSIAPNFTATDVNGNTYTLYDILDQGKTVIMDVSATWCGPCWAYHNSKALENAWEALGPGGSDKAMIFMVEGDESTNFACLQGDVANCNNSTLGNWLDGTKYPVIDDHTIAELYKTTFFPTIFAICPDRRVKQIGQVPTPAIITYVQNCPASVGVNNGAIYKMVSGNPGGDYFCETGSVAPFINFQNLGSQTMTSAVFSLKLNGELIQTKPWTGNLKTYELGSVQFDLHHFPYMDIVEVAVEMEKVNGDADDQPADNQSSTVILPTFNIATENMVKFEMRVGIEGNETRWEFISPDGNVLYKGGNPNVTPGGQHPNLGPGGYTPNEFVRDTFFLPKPGCYAFHVMDDGGDGFGTQDAYYKITTLDGSVIMEGGDFEAERRDWVKAEGIPTSNKPTLADASFLKITPNPAAQSALVSWAGSGLRAESLSLSDLAGKQLRRQSLAAETTATELIFSDLQPGTYFVSVEGEGLKMVKKLVVLH